MKGLAVLVVSLPIIVSATLSLVALAALSRDPTAEAWSAWRAGDIRSADAMVRDVLVAEPDNARARHLRILTASLMGEHRVAVDELARLDPDYHLYGSVVRFGLDAYLHLGEEEAALELAVRSQQDEIVIQGLRQRAARPLAVALESATEVPFLDDNLLGQLMPAVAIEIDGTRMEGHIDTGGSFLNMAPSTAEALGIELVAAGRGVANNRATSLRAGIAGSLTLGDAVLTDVPVTTVESLEGQLEGLVIVGTNILQQFLSTWDNQARRLILTPRGDEAARAHHLSTHAAGDEGFGFYLARDHFLWGSGAVGMRDVTFFLDTGLVALDLHGRQATMGVPVAVLQEWGIEPDGADFVESPGSIRLGTTSRPGGAIHVWPDTRNLAEVFGLRPQALLSFGFFKHFNWTIDFDTYRMYLVPVATAGGEAGESAEPGGAAGSVDLHEYAGAYEVVPGIALQVSVGDNGLLLQAPGQQRVPMTHEGTDLFAISMAGAEIRFERDDAGDVVTLVLVQAGNTTRAARKSE